MCEIGTIVKSRSGHDKDRYFAVIGFKDKLLKLSDGKQRPIERPKLKSQKHVELTEKTVSEESMSTNKRLRKALWAYNYQNKAGTET
jgi:ribosomal protein L14E/L6E/L27E